MSKSQRHPSYSPPRRLWLTCLLLGLVGWGFAAARHALLQSNAYDLGLFDQWAWLISQGDAPISSMEGVHWLADHGAWAFALAGGLYAITPSIQWLLATQALALSFTALPIWMLASQAGLKQRLCWLACGLWWLQPVVFNSNLFDFHPEVWVMPALALCLWAERANKPRLWMALLLLLLGCRGGLVLITAGITLELAWRRRWRWASAAALLSASWLLMLSRWLYPWLRDGEGPKAAGRMFSHLSGGPAAIASNLDWAGGLSYLLLLALPCVVLWRKRSLTVLLIGLPLVLVNLLSASSSYRTLVHHYSLPLAVITVLAAIDGLACAENHRQGLSRQRQALVLGWAALCWLALAKPWFFTGPYLERLSLSPEANAAIAAIAPQEQVLTTSYLVPHLSQRQQIAFPKKGASPKLQGHHWTTLLLHPGDPGWGSSAKAQQALLTEARNTGWHCRRWPSGLELCQRPGAAPPLPPGSEPGRTHRGR